MSVKNYNNNDNQHKGNKRKRSPVEAISDSLEGPTSVALDNHGEIAPHKPMQPTIKAQNLADFIHRVHPRPFIEWTEEEKSEIGNCMANRDGFSTSDRKAIAEAGLAGEQNKLEWFFKQYINGYQSDANFLKLIDPWLVICVGVPTTAPARDAYVASVHAANVHMGGTAGLNANAAGEPIQFGNGNLDTVLRVADRSTALQVAAYVKGLNPQNAFVALVVEYNFLQYAIK